MVTYLLLRNNKQSGPFALEELRTAGLKAYDLVWIEGKSAAWRYPSEIDELKPFAPIVEEQPYDRFFKRPAANTTSINTPSNGNTIIQPRPAAENDSPRISTSYPAVITSEPSAIPGKRIIYVTLPAGSKSGVLRETVSTEIPVPRSVTESRTADHLSDAITNIVSDSRNMEKPDSFARENSGPSVSDRPDIHTTGNVGNTGKIEYKISRYAEQEVPTVELLPQTNRSGSRRILRPLGIAVGVLALLASGVFIGISINRDNLFDFTQRDASNTAPVKSTQQLADNSTTKPAVTQNTPDPAIPVSAPAANTSAIPVIVTPEKGASLASGQPVTSSVTKTSVIVLPVKDAVLTDKSQKQPVNAEQKTSATTLPSPVKDSATLSIPVAHREAIHQTDASPEKDAFRNNIANLVSVSANTYNVGTFGGISDLQLTVNNRSAFPLDLVVVEVQYVQANKKVFKKETLSFHDIGAGSALMLEAPKTSRGIKVEYKVTLISSKELGLSYSAI